MKDSRIEPDAVKDDPNSVEMASIWIAGGGLHCSLKIGMYEDTGNVDERKAWGVMLSDVIGHVSDGLYQAYGYERSTSIKLILEALLAEVDLPTSDLKGVFAD
jgi:hypothetical protein